MCELRDLGAGVWLAGTSYSFEREELQEGQCVRDCLDRVPETYRYTATRLLPGHLDCTYACGAGGAICWSMHSRVSGSYDIG